MEDILPINMYVEGKEYQGYLATLYPVAHFGRDAFEVAYKSPRKCWYHFVRLTNSKAKKMIKKAFYDYKYFFDRPDECLAGYLGKKNEYKLYPGKLRNIVFYHYQ